MSSLKRLFLLLWLTLACGLGSTAHAQLNVSLQIKRRMFLLNEPVIATVTIVNNTGHEIMLADTQEGGPWFSFQINGDNQHIVPPRDHNYELQPLPMKPGETVKRTVNLTELYELSDYGSYHATASIYFPPMARFFSSRPDNFELTEGRLIWKQTVGVPDSPESLGVYRTFSLLTLEHDKGKMLYVRVEGQNDGTIYGCYNLGRVLDGFPPDAKFDTGNNLAVLQTIGRREYLFSRVGIGGNFISQNTYVSLKAQPFLRKLQDGTLQIVGGIRQDPKPASTNPADAPKLSDRPAGLPR